jgi:hypothetical protein
MKYPCRCNKPSCQARVIRRKHPDEYKVKKYSMCPRYPACDGKLYVDSYRLNKGGKDRAPECREDCLPYLHRYDNKGCRHYEEYVIERNLIDSRHNPHRNLEPEFF